VSGNKENEWLVLVEEEELLRFVVAKDFSEGVAEGRLGVDIFGLRRGGNLVVRGELAGDDWCCSKKR
jgi:hypothetical protein